MIFISFHQLLWFQVLLSLVLSHSSDFSTNEQRPLSFVSLGSQPKRVRYEGKENDANAGIGKTSVVDEASKNYALLVLANYIDTNILTPFKHAYRWQKGDSWNRVLEMGPEVLTALEEVNYRRHSRGETQISPKVFKDAVNFFRARTRDVAHKHRHRLDPRTLEGYWRLIAGKLPSRSRELIQELLQRRGLISSKFRWSEDHRKSGSRAEVAMAAINIFEFIVKEIDTRELPQALFRAIDWDLRYLRNQNAHPTETKTNIKEYAEVLRECTEFANACDFIAVHA